MALSRAVRLAIAALAAAMLVLVSAPFARAEYEPPPIHGHVNDKAGKLTAAEVAQLNAKLDGVNQRTSAEIAVYLPASLDGNTVEDVAYYTFKAWKLGKRDEDNSVLLVVAPAERKIYITTGRGVGDRLTDLQSKDISRKIGRHLKEGRFYAGIDEGTTLIASALGDDGSRGPRAPPPKPRASEPRITTFHLMVGLIVILVIVRIVIAALRRRGGGGYHDGGGGPPIIFFGGGGGDSGGGWGGGDSGGGDSGGGGGDFSGGGGDTGGGGAGSDY
jgi:uncharacterized protein